MRALFFKHEVGPGRSNKARPNKWVTGQRGRRKNKRLVFVNTQTRNVRKRRNNRKRRIDRQEIVGGDSKAKAKQRMSGTLEREKRSGSKAIINKRGERGHPCLTPRSISIHEEVDLPKQGATLTFVSIPLTKNKNQEGKETRFKI